MKPLVPKLILVFLYVNFLQMMHAQVDVHVKNEGSIYISKGEKIYIKNPGSLHTENATQVILDSDSDEYASFFVFAAGTGDITYKRWTASSSSTNDLVSAPVSGDTFDVFATRNSGLIAEGTITSGALLYGPFDNSTLNYTEYFASNTVALTSGTGYRAGTTGEGHTLSYEGSPVTSDVTISINNSAGSQFGLVNLIGNPYPSYLDAQKVLEEMVSSGAVHESYTGIYGYDGDVTGTDPNTWTIVNFLNASNYSITPGQGFVIASDSDGIAENLTLTTEMLIDASNDDFIMGRNTNLPQIEAQFRIQLEQLSTEVKYNTEFYFLDSEEVTRNLDIGWDAGAFSLPQGLHIASLLAEGSNSVDMQMQCLGVEDLERDSDLVIPLSVKTSSGGDHSISLNDAILPNDAQLYLQDTYLGTVTELTSNDYVFTTNFGINTSDRFFLTTNSNVLSTEDVAFTTLGISSLQGRKAIRIVGSSQDVLTLKLYDITGRTVYVSEVNLTTANSVDKEVSFLSYGIYIAKLTNSLGNKKTVKLLIN